MKRRKTWISTLLIALSLASCGSMGTAESSTEETPIYTVSFYNQDTLLTSTTVESGMYASYLGETPTRQYESGTTYVFRGWDKDLETTPIFEDTCFYAMFDEHPDCVVTFDTGTSYGGSITTKTVPWGSYLQRPSNPTRAERNGQVFTFVAWATDYTSGNGNYNVNGPCSSYSSFNFSSTKIVGDITLYAVFSVKRTNTYSLSLGQTLPLTLTASYKQTDKYTQTYKTTFQITDVVIKLTKGETSTTVDLEISITKISDTIVNDVGNMTFYINGVTDKAEKRTSYGCKVGSSVTHKASFTVSSTSGSHTLTFSSFTQS